MPTPSPSPSPSPSPFDTTNDSTIMDNPCCCCGKFDIAVAIVNCNGITDDNFDFYMTDFTTPLVSLTEPFPGSPDDPCTETHNRNRGHWLTPTGYTGPHPDSKNLYCGAKSTQPVHWDDHSFDKLKNIGDACVVQFALRTTNNNGCQNFGHIYFYRVIHGNPDSTPPILDSLCLMQTVNYQPGSYDPPGSPTSGTYYCEYQSLRTGGNCSSETTATDPVGGPYSTDVDCYNNCNFEFYYLNRCDNGSCCKGYWCMTDQAPFHGTKKQAMTAGTIVSGPWLSVMDAYIRGGCLPYWCVSLEEDDAAFCQQGISSDAVEALDPGFYTVTGGPYYSSSACASACVFVCPCCPAFTTSPLLATFSVPSVLDVNQFTLTYNPSTCNWTGSISQFGGTCTMTIAYNSSCKLTFTVTVPAFVGPTTFYTDVDTNTFDCSTMPHTVQGGGNLYDGHYGQVVLALPGMMAFTAPKPSPIMPGVKEAAVRKGCGCAPHASLSRQQVRGKLNREQILKKLI